MKPAAVIILIVLTIHLVPAQTSADSAAIRATALNYVEGWYEANPNRMAQALHPELAKRIVGRDTLGNQWLSSMGATQLIQGTRRGGKDTPKAEQQKDVFILDIYENTASVKAVMSGWIDYMHMAKWNGEWRIVNVLWELKPRR